MSEAVVDDIVAVLPPLLQSLEALSFIARHLNPPEFGRVMEAAGGSTDNIIKMVVWAKDKAFKNAVNKEWNAMFPDEHSRPARHTMLYGGFTGNTLIQCEIVAVLDSNEAPVTLRD